MVGLNTWSRKNRSKLFAPKLNRFALNTMAYKLGSGQRFAALTDKLKKKAAKNPKALAAWIGRRKYGKSKFQKLAARGK